MAPGLVEQSAAQTGHSSIDKDLLPEDDDLLYEEELLRNPYSLRMWWRYLEARKDAAQKRRFLLYERAISALPGSYKVQQGDGIACPRAFMPCQSADIHLWCSFGMHT